MLHLHCVVQPVLEKGARQIVACIDVLGMWITLLHLDRHPAQAGV